MVLGLLWKWEFLELGNGLLGLEKLCHEDIALLGQFCVEVIAYCHEPYTEWPWRVIKNISNKFHPEALTIIILVALKLENVGPTFQEAVSRNSAKLGNYKMLVKLSETQK